MPRFPFSARYRGLRVCLPGLVVLGVALPLAAQQAPSYTRNELDLGATTDPVGPSLRYTYNLSSSLAVETRLSGLPSPLFAAQDTLLLSAGVKAGLRRKRWGFYGVIDPGWSVRPDRKIRYASAVIDGIDTIYPVEDRSILRSRFALDTGVAVEYAVTPRTFLRLDVVDTLEPTFLEQQFKSLTIGIVSPGNIGDHASLSVSVGHRFGELREDTGITPKAAHVDFGALFSLYGRTHLLAQDVLFNPGYGGWVSYGLKPHLSLDASAFRSGHDDKTGYFQDGGKEALAFAGIKSGIRRDRVGIFVKARGGAVRFSRTYSGSTFATLDDYINDFQGHATWQPAVDLGAVVEVYPARHVILRAEAGPTIIHYRATTFGLEGQTFSIPGSTGSSVLLLFGGGFRF